MERLCHALIVASGEEQGISGKNTNAAESCRAVVQDLTVGMSPGPNNLWNALIAEIRGSEDG
jgi:hypothetical protein